MSIAWMALWACGSATHDAPRQPIEDVAETPAEPSVSIVVSHPPATLPVGSSAQLQASAMKGSVVLSDVVLSYRTSDPGILTVTQGGEMMGISGGLAWVTLRGAGGTAMVEINVVP